MGGTVLGLAGLALAYAMTMLVASLPVPVHRRHAAAADGDGEGGEMQVMAALRGGDEAASACTAGSRGRRPLPRNTCGAARRAEAGGGSASNPGSVPGIGWVVSSLKGVSRWHKSKSRPMTITGRLRPVPASRPAKAAAWSSQIVSGAAAIVASLWNAVTADGTLAAAGRQGIDELGVALKAFPDAVQVQETGTLWNPTQGEIAADRKQAGLSSSYASYSASSGPPHPWPSEIANENRNQPGKDTGNGYEKDTGYSM